MSQKILNRSQKIKLTKEINRITELVSHFDKEMREAREKGMFYFWYLGDKIYQNQVTELKVYLVQLKNKSGRYFVEFMSI